ncbi:hypothetical protein RCL1_004881 [Eukaryota sp. TZLM3-RCL]
MFTFENVLNLVLERNVPELINLSSQFYSVFTLTDDSANTLLHYVATEDIPEILILLLAPPFSLTSIVNQTNNLHQTPLHLAVASNSLESVSILIQNNSNMSILDSKGNSCLDYLISSTNPSIDILNLLLKNRCPLNNSFHDLIRADKQSLVKVFLSSSSINFNQPHSTTFHTPLHYAVLSGNYNLVELLATRGVLLCTFDINGNSPLYDAIKLGFVEIALFLLELELNLINLINNFGFSVFHALGQALNINSFDKNWVLLTQLIHQFNPNLINSVSYKNSLTPIHLAVLFKNYEAVLLFLNFKPNLFLLNNSNQNLLYLFEKESDAKLIARILVSISRHELINLISSQDFSGNTVLHHYWEQKQSFLFVFLIGALRQLLKEEISEIMNIENVLGVTIKSLVEEN